MCGVSLERAWKRELGFQFGFLIGAKNISFIVIFGRKFVRHGFESHLRHIFSLLIFYLPKEYSNSLQPFGRKL